MNKEELHKFIEEKQPNICQIVAYKDNEKVYSDCWNNYKEDDCVHIMSATKSIMALLIGIAIDKGQIGSIDDKVLNYFPDYKVKRGEKTIYDVTIKHLLTMRAPYKCKGDPWSKVCSSDNWTYSSLDYLGGRKGLTDEYNRFLFETLEMLPQYCARLNSTQNSDERRKILDEIYAIISYRIGPRIGGFRRINVDGDIISVQKHEGIALSPHKDLEMLYYFEKINYGFGVEKLIDSINGKIGIGIKQSNGNMCLESENKGPKI